MNQIRKPNGWRRFAFKIAVLCLVWLLLATTFAAQFYWIGKDWPLKISWKESFMRALVEWCPWMILSPAVMWLAERCRFDRARRLWGVFPHVPACVLAALAYQGISMLLMQRQGSVVFHEFHNAGGRGGFTRGGYGFGSGPSVSLGDLPPPGGFTQRIDAGQAYRAPDEVGFSVGQGAV